MILYSFRVPLHAEGETGETDSPKARRRRGEERERFVLLVVFSIDESDASPQGVDAEVLLDAACEERASQARSVPLSLRIVLERRVRSLLAKNSRTKLQTAVETLTQASERLSNTASAGGLRVQEKRASAERLKRIQAEEEQAAAVIQQTLQEDLLKTLRLYRERFPRWHLGEMNDPSLSSPGGSHGKWPLLVEAERALKEDASAAAAVDAARKAAEEEEADEASFRSSWVEKYGLGSPFRRALDETVRSEASSFSPRDSSSPKPPAAAIAKAVKGAVSRELLHARRYTEGYRQYLASSNSFEQKKLRLALVVSALEHNSDYHSADSIAGNEYSFGPFYNEKTKEGGLFGAVHDRYKGREVDHLHLEHDLQAAALQPPAAGGAGSTFPA